LRIRRLRPRFGGAIIAGELSALIGDGEGGGRKTVRRTAKGKAKAPRCADCFFRQNLLCALQLDEPCSTFRPGGPQGLVPPRQPALLMRSRRRLAQGIAGV
jgi:hypothetical protein